MTERPTPPEHGLIIQLGEYRVRVRRVGEPHAAIRVLWEILDGERIAATQMSRPSRDDCARAVSIYRGQVEAVTVPKPGPFIPGALPTRDKRAQQRRARQMAEEAEEE